MKIKLHILLATLLLSAIGPIGCSTTPTGQIVVGGQVIDPIKVGRQVSIAATTGTRWAIRQDPNTKAYFQAADALLTSTLDAGNYDPSSLRAALMNISVKEIRENATVADIIGAALALYSDHFGDVVAKKLDANIYVKPVLLGLRDGIRAGLQ